MPETVPVPEPPAYLALDLWVALGCESGGFDAYYQHHGWAETWAALLHAVREARGETPCGVMVDDEPCVLLPHSMTPHTGASDVGAWEPIPWVSEHDGVTASTDPALADPAFDGVKQALKDAARLFPGPPVPVPEGRDELKVFIAPADWREQLQDVADVAGQIHVLESWMVPPPSGDVVEQASLAMQQHHIDPAKTDADRNDYCICGGWASGPMEPGWDDHLAAALLAAGLLAPVQPPPQRFEDVWHKQGFAAPGFTAMFVGGDPNLARDAKDIARGRKPLIPQDDETVERVARASYDAYPKHRWNHVLDCSEPMAWEDLSQTNRAIYLHRARAAIRALGDTTDKEAKDG